MPRCGRWSIAGSNGGVILDDTPDRLGSLTDAAGGALAELTERDAVARAWAGDHTLWRDDPTEVTDRLGWLTVASDMVARLDGLRAQCRTFASQHDHVLLMGMGGSSLFPEVIARSSDLTGAAAPDDPPGATPPDGGWPTLHVLDTTDPAAVARLATDLPADRTMHIAASKSGTTLETRSHLAWAWERHSDPARFAAITDPGSELADLAADRGFAALWENRPDIGGRYSALSLFGLVPALLAGADVDGLLASATAMADRLRSSPGANPAARLAATMAAGVRSGRDKLTVLVPDRVAAFGLWLEQLIAESTGKDGTGVVPVVGETPAEPGDYGDDRVFVGLGDHPGLDALADAGHPVTLLPCDDAVADLGGQVVLWELATALCGALLGIQPFDQPDVASAKAATGRVLERGEPDHVPSTPLDDLLGTLQAGDYLAIQAFVDPGASVASRLDEVRHALRDRLRIATTLGFGPRFLHSTGQLHKGGPDSVVCVQVVGDDPDDVPVPGAGYGFSRLKRAQADGDLVALRDRGRRVGRVALDELLDAVPA
jgi:glucose-6-phosphate isomerase